MNSLKYGRRYCQIPRGYTEWAQKDNVEKAPGWCSHDLAEGNLSLIAPMSLDEKIDYFQMLVKMGMKEISLGIPALHEAEADFLHVLLEKNLVPSDVILQVHTTDQESVIRKTYELIREAGQVIVVLLQPVSSLILNTEGKKEDEELLRSAKKSAQLMKKLSAGFEDRFLPAYCPQGFSGMDVQNVLALAEACFSVWKPAVDRKAMLCLDDCAEEMLPSGYASLIEYFHRNLSVRESVLLSFVPANDRGCAVAAAELALLAGADRIEGSLFGNGDRAGRADLINLAMNLLSHGTDPHLELSDLPDIRNRFEKLTGMLLSERQPYAGDLVFAAFGQHKHTAIRKGIDAFSMEEGNLLWKVPYLTIDPLDVGRSFTSDMKKINTRTGKNKAAYILKQNFGLSLPEGLKNEADQKIREAAAREQRELVPDTFYQCFEDIYIHNNQTFTVKEHHYEQVPGGIIAKVTIAVDDKAQTVTANGNGRLSSVSNAIRQYFNLNYELTCYEEHSLSRGSSSKAVTYVGVSSQGGMHWGVGIHEDIIVASINALVAAVNQLEEIRSINACRDQRMLEIQNYIQSNYLTVTLDELSAHFYLSKPYLSKYIREKSGNTFGDLVKKVRMKKARTFLKNRNMTVESIAESVGYQNVEHFNRLFKKAYGMTPIQYRNQK